MIKKHSAMMVLLISCLAGLSDTTTGLGLVLLPAKTLALMGVEASDYPIAMIQFIGAFVLGTGSLYLWGVYLFKKTSKWDLLKMIWLATAWLRVCVAIVTCYLVLSKGLSSEWMSVPLTDGILAVLQFGWIGLKQFPQDA